MNLPPPSWVTEAAEEALKSVAANHYSHPKGRLRLREAVKNHYEADFGRNLNVETEILITSGASEGQSQLFRSMTHLSFTESTPPPRPILYLRCIFGARG